MSKPTVEKERKCECDQLGGKSSVMKENDHFLKCPMYGTSPKPTECEHEWKTVGGSRFDESFECKICLATKDVHEGIGETTTRIKIAEPTEESWEGKLRGKYYKDFDVGSYRPALEGEIDWWIKEIKELLQTRFKAGYEKGLKDGDYEEFNKGYNKGEKAGVEKVKARVGILRQLLNEGRIDDPAKMIDNEYILQVLDILKEE